MTWNYRIIQHDTYFGLHECFYNEQGEIYGFTEEAIVVCNLDEGIELIQKQLDMMSADIKRSPALIEKDIKFVDMPGINEEAVAWDNIDDLIDGDL